MIVMISKIIFVQKVAPNGEELISSSDDDDNQFKKWDLDHALWYFVGFIEWTLMQGTSIFLHGCELLG